MSFRNRIKTEKLQKGNNVMGQYNKELDKGEER